MKCTANYFKTCFDFNYVCNTYKTHVYVYKWHSNVVRQTFSLSKFNTKTLHVCI